MPGRRVEEREISRDKVKRALEKIKCGGEDEFIPKFLQKGKGTELRNSWSVCMREDVVPGNWQRMRIVVMYT